MRAFRPSRSRSKEVPIDQKNLHLALAPAAAPAAEASPQPKDSVTLSVAVEARPAESKKNSPKEQAQRERKVSKSHIADSWLNPTEAADINRLIAAARTQPNVLKERRRSVSSDAQPFPEEARASTGAKVKEMTPRAKKRPGEIAAPEAESKLAAALAAVSLTAASDVDKPSDAVAGQASCTPTKGTSPFTAKSTSPPTNKSSSPAMRRWKAATGAVAAARNVDEANEDIDSQRAQLYKLLSHNESSVANLSGAAARGARAAAVGRVKAASAAVGGKFLTPEEWQAMKFEMAQLREKAQRLTRENQELNAKLRAAREADHDATKLAALWGPDTSTPPRDDERHSSSSFTMKVFPQVLKSLSPSLKRPPKAIRSS